MGTGGSQGETEISIPFESQIPGAPESFNKANVHPSSSQPPAQSKAEQGKAEAKAVSSESHAEDAPSATTSWRASEAEADHNDQPSQAASSQEAAQQSSSHVSSSAEGQVMHNLLSATEAAMQEKILVLGMTDFWLTCELLRRIMPWMSSVTCSAGR